MRRPQIIAAYWKWNTPRARWQQIDTTLVFFMVDSYRTKFVYSDGEREIEVTRGVGEPLHNSEGRVPEVDGE
jgi:hypothetical protein